jgi:hypothetical protein
VKSSPAGPSKILQRRIYLGFEVLTPVVTKTTTFWDITPCSMMEVNRRFGGTYRLHIQDQGISQAGSKQILGSRPYVADMQWVIEQGERREAGTGRTNECSD